MFPELLGAALPEVSGKSFPNSRAVLSKRCSSPGHLKACPSHLLLGCFCDVMQISSPVFGYIPGAVLAQVLVGQHFYIR